MLEFTHKIFILTVMLLSILPPSVSLADQEEGESEKRTVLRDEEGRLTQTEEGGHVTTYTYDQHGRQNAIVSQLFGTTTYAYEPNSSGPFARVLSKEQSNAAGTWKIRSVHHQQGERVLLLQGVHPELLSRILHRLEPYFWPEGLPSREIDSLPTASGEGFASISNIPGKEGDTQITQIFGRRMEIQTSLNGEQREVSDDAGGKRVEIWGDSGRVLSEVYTEQGSLLKAYLDPHGRPERVIVGGSTAILYNFDPKTGQLAEKHVADLESGEILGSWKIANTVKNLTTAPPARRSALAFLPSSIPVAEWDDGPLSDGAILVTRLGKPYALIPFEEGPIWRSVSTHFPGITITDRIDYTDSQIRIFLSLGSAPYALGSEAVVVLERDRHQLSEIKQSP